jgi:DNA modification methylase
MCEHCGEEFDADPQEGHRLLCGDATKASDVGRATASAKAAVCLTDPPYGLGDSVTEKNKYADYDDSEENLEQTIAEFFPLAKARATRIVLTPGTWNQWRYPQPTWVMAWFTPAGVGTGPWGFCCWQPILCYGSDPKLAHRKGRFPDAIVHTESAEKLGHPCAKPVKFWCWLMERCSEPADRVSDPFSGAGTTIMAGEMSGRICAAIEISPAYVDIGVVRWQNFSGRPAILADDGRTYDQIAAVRGMDVAA